MRLLSDKAAQAEPYPHRGCEALYPPGSECLLPPVKLSVACIFITSALLLGFPSWALSSLSDSQTPESSPFPPRKRVVEWAVGPGPGPSAPYLPTTQLPAFFPCLSQSPAEVGGLSRSFGAGPMRKRPRDRARQPRSFTADFLSRVTQPV